MKNQLKIAIVALILVVTAIVVPSIVKAANGSDDTSAVVITTTSSTSNGGDDAPSSVTSNSTDNGSKSSTSNSTDNGGNSSTSNSTDNGSNSTTSNGGDDKSNVNPTTPSTGGSTGGSSTGAGSGGPISTGNVSHSTGNTASVITAFVNGNCMYIKTYMKLGQNNDSADVMRLQAFLKNSENLNVDINGNFDQKTVDAVKAFQSKYMKDIMTPWGVNTPTGQVFFTTQKKVNEIVCKTIVNLTPAQLEKINAYKDSIKNGSITIDLDGNVIKNASSTNTSDEVGTNDAPLKANLADTGFFGRIWGFVKWLFGY